MKLALVFVVFSILPYFILAAYNNEVLEPRQTNISSSVSIHSRRKRFLDFMKSSRVFFRANIKENVFTYGSLWAHASGWKANNPILNDLGTRPFRRDTYEMLRDMMDLHGFDGQACMLNLFCTVTRDADGYHSNGILFKLLRHVFKWVQYLKGATSSESNENKVFMIV